MPHRASRNRHVLRAMEISDTAYKKQVRERDGHRCRKCGITAGELEAEGRRGLEVHRLFPGISYEAVGLCVTLCKPCHDLMPRKVDGLIWPKKCCGIFGLVVSYHRDFSPELVKEMREFQERMAEKYGEGSIYNFGEKDPPPPPPLARTS
jgi:hypothetical protein